MHCHRGEVRAVRNARYRVPASYFGPPVGAQIAAEGKTSVSRNQSRCTRPSICRSLPKQQAPGRLARDVMEDVRIRRRRIGPRHWRTGAFAAAWNPGFPALDSWVRSAGRALQRPCDAAGSTGSLGTASVAAIRNSALKFDDACIPWKQGDRELAITRNMPAYGGIYR